MKLLKTAAIVVAASLVLFAQDKDKDKKPADHSGKQEAQQGAPAGTPTKQAAEMQKALRAMQGTWSTKAVFEKSDFMPNGGSDSGTAVFKPGPGGLSMMQDYRSKGAMGDFHGFSLVWFDPKDQMFHSVWCDPMTPSGCTESGKGKWDGDKIALTAKTELGGKTYDVRSTIGPFQGNTFKYQEEVGENGQFKPSMTITYTRTSGPAAAKKANPKM